MEAMIQQSKLSLGNEAATRRDVLSPALGRLAQVAVSPALSRPDLRPSRPFPTISNRYNMTNRNDPNSLKTKDCDRF